MGFSDALNEIGNPLDGMQESTMYSSRMGISALEFNTSLVIRPYMLVKNLTFF